MNQDPVYVRIQRLNHVQLKRNLNYNRVVNFAETLQFIYNELQERT